jgi:nucleotide-binding universal stress UspA family protein
MVQVPKVILVPVDYGELAGSALREAVIIARASRGGLVILHAGVDPKRADLDDFAREHIPADIPYSLRLTNEPAASAIARAAEDLSADLVVMGSHSRPTLTRLVLGDVASQVQELTKRPVMTIGHRLDEARPIRRILTGIDFSDTSRAAYDEACMLARLMNASLTATHVVRPGSATEDYSATALDAWLPPTEPDDPPFDRRIVHGDPATLIVHLARIGEYDLILLGGGGRITNWVARQAHCPVIAVHAPAMPDFAYAPIGAERVQLTRSSR